MGVQGLWSLLAPVGQRVAIQTLAHKRVAVDVSIWLIQFVKSMRDERGDMMRNAHLLGFFRRICKLLFNRIRPIFVFDGGAPFLKRRTIIARRRLRDQSNSKLRKAAEKLLINQLKLREVERSLSRPQAERLEAKKKPAPETSAPEAENAHRHGDGESQKDKEKAEQDEKKKKVEDDEDKDGYEDTAVIVPEDLNRFDPVAIASLPPSMALELLDQMREQRFIENRSKFQQFSEEPESFSQVQMESYLKNSQFKRKVEVVRQHVSTSSTVNGVQTQRVASDPTKEILFQKDKDTSIFSRSGPVKTGSKPPEILQDSVLPNPFDSKLSFSNTAAKLKELPPSDFSNSESAGKVRTGGELFGMNLGSNSSSSSSSSSESRGSELSEDENGDGASHGENNDGGEHNGSTGLSPSSGHQGKLESTSACDISIDVSLGANTSTDVEVDLDASMDDIVFLNEIGEDEEEESTGAENEEWIQPADNKPQLRAVLGHHSSEAADAITEIRAEEVEYAKTNQLVEDDEQSQPSAGKGISISSDPLSLDKAKETNTNQEPTNGVTSIELKHQDEIDAYNKGVENDTNRVAQMPPTQNSDSEDSDDPELKAAIQMSIMDLQASKNDSSASSSNLAQSKDFSAKSNGPNDKDDDDENFNMQLQRAMELSLAASGPKNDESDGKLLDVSATKESIECAAGDSSSDSEIPAMILPSPAKKSKGKEKVDAHVEMPEQVEKDAPEPPPMSREDVELYKEELLKEETNLRQEIHRQERLSESVTPEMIAEAQELLRMFGIPYIVAPMEAEAQCAQLEKSRLVDAVVTDDGDAFLFGARVVYKNIFEQQKYAELYRIEYVEKEMRLDRESLINLAILLGSDYTEGIHGIGIVNAYEIVTAFPGQDGLRGFQKWLDTPDIEGLETEREEQQSERVLEFKRKHKAVKKNWEVPPGFPSQEVIDAYVSPKVDESTEDLEWGRPDVEALLAFCQDRFGWNSAKAKEVLDPILAAYDDRSRQTQINEYFDIAGPVAKIRSKRIREALISSGGSSSLVLPKNNESSDKDGQEFHPSDDVREGGQQKRKRS